MGGIADRIKLTPEEKSYIDRTTVIALEKIQQGYSLYDILNWLRDKYRKEFPIKIRKVEHKRPGAEDEAYMEEPA